MAERDVEKLRTLTPARSCYCLLQKSPAAARPSSSYTCGGRNSYSKRRRNTWYTAIGCRDILQKSRRLARPRRHAERRTDHVVLRVRILDASGQRHCSRHDFKRWSIDSCSKTCGSCCAIAVGYEGVSIEKNCNKRWPWILQPNASKCSPCETVQCFISSVHNHARLLGPISRFQTPDAVL